MSIIDQARDEADLTLTGDSGGPWAPDVAFVDGASWLLDQLTDPDQATVDAVAQGMFADFWMRDGTLPMPNKYTTWDGTTDDIRNGWREDARAAITALTNHLNGAPS